MGLGSKKSTTISNQEFNDNTSLVASDGSFATKEGDINSSSEDNSSIIYTDLGAIEAGTGIANNAINLLGVGVDSLSNGLDFINSSASNLFNDVGNSFSDISNNFGDVSNSFDNLTSSNKENVNTFISGSNRNSEIFVNESSDLAGDFVSSSNDLTGNFLNTSLEIVNDIVSQVFTFGETINESNQALANESFNLAGSSTLGAGFSTADNAKTTSKTLIYGAAIMAVSFVLIRKFKK